MRLTRVTLLCIACIIGLGFYQLARYFLDEVEPQTFQATEEVMVDTSHLLAEMVGHDMANGNLDTAKLRDAFTGVHKRRFQSLIFEHLKDHVGIDAYLTDDKGVVLFDSQNGRREGMDLSCFRDVSLTLSGKYGARSSREDEDNPASSVLYVAAPVGDPAKPSGVLTVFKPQADAFPMIRHRRQVILRATGIIGAGILLLVGAVFVWVYRPIGRLTDYTRAIERGERPERPRLGVGREVNTLARALESMREALEGRSYAERYIQTLTHEMKSPLAAIRGAAELLDEDMPEETRKHFLANIRLETARADRLISRLLELSAIESKSSLENPESLDLREIAKRALEQAGPLAEAAGIRFEVCFPDVPVTLHGDSFILRAAVTNLLENAIDFSPAGGTVRIAITREGSGVSLTVEDEGAGVPDYAAERVFERFYSLRHHRTSGRKGSGLGLSLVKEAVELHGGSASLENLPDRGARATLRFG